MRDLADMPLEELWELFPIQLAEHKSEYAKWYAAEEADLISIFSEDEIFRISHVGSTAVPGLRAKPIIDVLLELGPGFDMQKTVELLESHGWILMYEDVSAHKLGLNKGYTPQGFADKVFHLHVRESGDWKELYFRDYLCAHPEVARQYEEIKEQLKAQFEHDRDAYTEGKTQFIAPHTARAREEFGHRYDPNR